jgi:multidrug efflux system outer membrane protein
LLAGCALQPIYQRPAMALGQYPAGEAYAEQSTGKGQPPAAEIGWRDFLRDARLQRLVALALENNRDLRVAVLNVEKARAQYRAQRAELFPQVGVSAGLATKHNPADGAGGTPLGTAHSDTAGLSAAWEPDLFDRLHNLSDAAFEQYLASGYARRAAAILLVSQVVDQDLTLRADDAQLALTERTLDNANAALRLVKLQFDAGTASELDLRLAETAVEQAGANRASQLRLRAQAENALRLLVGGPLPPDLPAPSSLDVLTALDAAPVLADVPAGLPSDLLERRPDVLQAEAVLRAEHADIGVARAAFFPRITLTGTLGSVSPALGDLFAAGSGAWTFAAALAAPLFDAGANRANLDVAVLQKDIGVAQYEKAVQTAFREVSDGLAARGTYGQQLEALQRYTATQQRRLELAELLYKNGVNSYLDVLTARTDLYSAQQALITARLNQLTSLVDLYRALGGGWLEHTGEKPPPAVATR